MRLLAPTKGTKHVVDTDSCWDLRWSRDQRLPAGRAL